MVYNIWPLIPPVASCTINRREKIVKMESIPVVVAMNAKIVLEHKLRASWWTHFWSRVEDKAKQTEIIRLAEGP